MLQFYLGWTNVQHYLDDFINVLTADLATPQRVQKENSVHQLFTNCFGIPRQDFKDIGSTVVRVFGLEVDKNNFIVRVPPNKLTRAQEAINLTPQPHSLTLKEAQFFTGFLSFCA